MREEEANVDVSLHNMCGTAIPPRLGAILNPMPSAVAVVAGVVAARSAFAAGITSPVTTSATGIGRAASAIALGLVLPAATGTTTPLLAVLGHGGAISLSAASAPLLGVQQLALLLRRAVSVLNHLESPGDVVDGEALEVEECLN
jgi:hypothetical protein